MARTLREEAQNRNISLDRLRQRCSRGQEPDAFNENGKWYFRTEGIESNPEEIDPKEFPDVEESKQKYEYFRTLKMKAEAQQAIRASQRSTGQLVNRKQVEDEYIKNLITLKDNLLQIPNRLKHKLAETSQITIDTLEDLIREVLEDAAN